MLSQDQAAGLRLIRGSESRARGTRPERIIAIGSGKGGVGKSNVAVNLAIELSRRGNSVCLFDADLGMANAHIIAGISPKHTLGHVMRGAKTIDEIIARGPEGIGLIAGSTGLFELTQLSAEQRRRLCGSLTTMKFEFDYLIIDSGAGISTNVLAFMESADQGIIIATPEPTSMADAYGMIKTLSQRGYEGRMSLIVNRAESIEEARKVSEKITSLSLQFLDQSVDSLGFILEDSTVSRAVRARSPFSVMNRSSMAARSISAIAQRIDTRTEETDYSANGIFAPVTMTGRIKGWIGRLLT